MCVHNKCKSSNDGNIKNVCNTTYIQNYRETVILRSATFPSPEVSGNSSSPIIFATPNTSFCRMAVCCGVEGLELKEDATGGHLSVPFMDTWNR